MKGDSMAAKWTTKEICTTAMLAAVVCVLTVVPRIPIPLGYAHLGDAAVFILGLKYGLRNGGTAAALGSGLADILGGFPIWAGPTLIIKFLMAWIVYKLAPKSEVQGWNRWLRLTAAFTASGLWLAIGYTVAGAALYDSWAAGMASLPGLLAEGAVNVLAALAVCLKIK